MSVVKTAVAFNRLRETPVWALLASVNAPMVAAILQANLMGEARQMSASAFRAAVDRDIQALRLAGEDVGQEAPEYIAQWLRYGFIERKLPHGAPEEQYSLAPAAARAIRFLNATLEPRSSATESRLATVIHQLTELDVETDTNTNSRTHALLVRRAQIDQEIADIQAGKVVVLPEERALERIQEILALARDLVADFDVVRERFELLNRTFRRSVIENEGGRGVVLGKVFENVDVIDESDEGRSFYALWQLLTDHAESLALADAIENLRTRPFAAKLTLDERRTLRRFTSDLLTAGGEVREVMRDLWTGLKGFVQSKEFLDQRRIRQLLKTAQADALNVKDMLRPTDEIGFKLPLTLCRIHSTSQLREFDPSAKPLSREMAIAESALLDADMVATMIADAEIDMRTLRENVEICVQETGQASIGQVLQRFPAPQGLGSVIGYISIASKKGQSVKDESETISWVGRDGVERRGHIPLMFFLKGAR